MSEDLVGVGEVVDFEEVEVAEPWVALAVTNDVVAVVAANLWPGTEHGIVNVAHEVVVLREVGSTTEVVRQEQQTFRHRVVLSVG